MRVVRVVTTRLATPWTALVPRLVLVIASVVGVGLCFRESPVVGRQRLLRRGHQGSRDHRPPGIHRERRVEPERGVALDGVRHIQSGGVQGEKGSVMLKAHAAIERVAHDAETIVALLSMSNRTGCYTTDY